MPEPGVPDDGEGERASEDAFGVEGESADGRDAHSHDHGHDHGDDGRDAHDHGDEVADASDSDGVLDLPCGERKDVHELDMGQRDFECACGASHAVVMDVHPLARFVPEFLVEILTETIETDDDFDEFTTAHAMASVMEEFPDQVATVDVAEDGTVGYALVWVTDFDSRRLHEVIVELIVELMEHAVSHAEDDEVAEQFEAEMLEFDVATFVEQYRRERDLETEHDTPI